MKRSSDECIGQFFITTVTQYISKNMIYKFKSQKFVIAQNTVHELK